MFALAALPAVAQTPLSRGRAPLALPAPPPVAAAAPAAAEALAWRSLQACLAVSRGATLDKAAAEAGYQKDGAGWVAEIAERTLTLELAIPTAPPGAKACVMVARGPLADHQGFAKRIDAWAVKEGFSPATEAVSPAGASTVRYATPDGTRALVLARFPETGNPDQPARSILFVGWTPAP